MEYAGDIHESGQHLLELINDILDLSKVEAGKIELYESTVDLTRAAQVALTLVKERAERGGVRVAHDLPAVLPFVRADERAIKQILINLLANAIKFTPDCGEVRVSVSADPGRGVVIEVRDTGIGIAPEDIPKALEPFGQIDSALNRKTDGTGLGLPLAQGLVELHGGTLELESRVGAGTTARVRLPAYRLIAGAISAA